MTRVLIDTTTCQGHGRCYGLAPELIKADDQGYPVIPAEGLEAEHDTAAELEDGCPEMAISLEA